MRVYDHMSTKFDAIDDLVKAHQFKMVIALGSQIFDIPLMQKADYSITLSSAPQVVKDNADLVLKEQNPDAIVAEISKIFSMRKINNLIGRH